MTADSHSPDGHYGVTVPKLNPDAPDQDTKLLEPKNSLIDLKTGRLLAAIQTEFTGYDHMNHDEILPSRWSKDGTLLLWEMDGKWSRSALVLLKIDGDRVPWQTDVLKVAQQTLLLRTKQAAPRAYAKWKKANAEMADGVDGRPTAYPEGFSIEVEASGPIILPLHVRAELTSEAKLGTNGYRQLQSHLEGQVDRDGKLIVKSFHLGPSHPSHF